MTGKQRESGVGLLKLKLGACLTGPTKRMVADLHAVLRDYNRASNAMIDYWERWRRDHLEYEPAAPGDSRCMSKAMGNEIYHRGRELVPHLYAQIVSAAARQVVGDLHKSLPRQHRGTAKYCWDGVLRYETSRPCYRGQVLPVLKQASSLCYGADMTGKAKPKAVGKHRPKQNTIAERVRQCGASSCVLHFSLFSRKSGRQITDVICRLEVRQLSRGNRLVLRRIACGEWDLRDSQLVYKNGQWYFHLMYHQPRRKVDLDPTVTATLQLAPNDAPQPFIITEGLTTWKLGHARMLLHEYDRMESRRQLLRWKYRNATSAIRGHGRQRVERRISPISQALKSLTIAFMHKLVSQVVQFCVRQNAGKLVYREPDMGLRRHCWFASPPWADQGVRGRRAIPCDWTELLKNIKHQCHQWGVMLEVKAMGVPEHRAGKADASGEVEG